jgi:hypothetical protein
LRPNANLSKCPSSPGAREPISAAIPFDLLRKQEVMVQKANVDLGKTKMDGVVRMRVTPHSPLKFSYRGRVVHSVALLSMERKK